jgi:hypothetical protein
VHKVLARYSLARLTWLDRSTGRVVRRYEHANPGDLVHVDIKKLGRIPDGGGHKVLGRAAGIRVKKGTKPGYPTCTTPRTTTPDWCTPRSGQRAQGDRCSVLDPR